MTVADIWSTALAVLASVGGGGLIVVGLSSWLGKVWASRILESEKNRYNREMEALRSGYSRELEQWKSELTKAHFDFQTRFGFYFEKRAESIMQIYGGLHMADARIADLVAAVQFGGEDVRIEKDRTAQEAFNQVAAEFYRSCIFLDEDTVDAIETVLSHMRIAFSAYRVGQNSGPGGGADFELLYKASQTMKNDVPPLMKELEQQFRAMVKVTSPGDAQLAHAAERAHRDRSICP